MNELEIALLGFGNVGRAFASYAGRVDQTEPRLRIRAVADRSGAAWVEDEDHLKLLVEHKASGRGIADSPVSYRTLDSQSIVTSLSGSGIRVLVETLPTNLQDGQPALALLEAALTAGIHVVTVDKGPLAHGFERLHEAARSGGARIGFTGTTGVGIPDEMGGEKVVEIRGVLNSTTNYILTEMQERAISFDAALAAAQESGIAEPDASLDIGGWDTAVKTLILAKTLMGSGPLGTPTRLDEVRRIGIDAAIEELIRSGRKMNRIVRLVGRARFHQGRVRVSVAPKLIAEDSPFYGLSGTSKLAVFRTADNREVISRALSSRDAIAQTIVDDIIRVCSEAG